MRTTIISLTLTAQVFLSACSGQVATDEVQAVTVDLTDLVAKQKQLTEEYTYMHDYLTGVIQIRRLMDSWVRNQSGISDIPKISATKLHIWLEEASVKTAEILGGEQGEKIQSTQEELSKLNNTITEQLNKFEDYEDPMRVFPCHAIIEPGGEYPEVSNKLINLINDGLEAKRKEINEGWEKLHTAVKT